MNLKTFKQPKPVEKIVVNESTVPLALNVRSKISNTKYTALIFKAGQYYIAHFIWENKTGISVFNTYDDFIKKFFSNYEILSLYEGDITLAFTK